MENIVRGTIMRELFAINWGDADTILYRNPHRARHLHRQIARLKKQNRIREAKRPVLRQEVRSCASC